MPKKLQHLSMPSSIVFLSFLAVTFMTASGFVKNSLSIPVDMNHELKLAGSTFGPDLIEDEVKDSFQSLKGKDRKRFQHDLAEADSMGDSNQSYIFEVRDGRKQLESAKIVAKHLLYKAVKDYWPGVEKSAMNDVDVKSFGEFSPFLRVKLETMIYSPSQSKNGEIVFMAGDWGRVIFTKSKTGKIASAKWSIDTNGTH